MKTFEERLIEVAKQGNVDLFIEISNNGVDPFIVDSTNKTAISYLSDHVLTKDEYGKVIEFLLIKSVEQRKKQKS